MNVTYKRYVQIGEGTHTVIMEKNRMQLFQAVQQFLDETLQIGERFLSNSARKLH